MTIKYDVIWYWSGGREVGEWRASTVQPYIDGAFTNPEMPRPGESQVQASSRRLDAMGYVNHPGLRSIGAPEGPPADAEFKALGL